MYRETRYIEHVQIVRQNARRMYQCPDASGKKEDKVCKREDRNSGASQQIPPRMFKFAISWKSGRHQMRGEGRQCAPVGSIGEGGALIQVPIRQNVWRFQIAGDARDATPGMDYLLSVGRSNVQIEEERRKRAAE